MTRVEKKLEFQTPRIASQLYCGKLELLKEVEKQLSVALIARDHWIQITGPEDAVAQAETFFGFLDHIHGIRHAVLGKGQGGPQAGHALGRDPQGADELHATRARRNRRGRWRFVRSPLRAAVA